jgi:phosphatidylinositol alpha-mannosyltransferase
MVTEYAYPILGGVSEHVHFLSRELAALGHDVTVITSRPPKALRDAAARLDARAEAEDGYRTLRVGHSMPVVSNGSIARVSVGFRLKAKVARAIREADVVHAQGLAPPTLGLFALRTSRAPVTVGTFHTYFQGGHWAYRVFLRYVAATLARLDRKIAVSRACLDALEPYFPGGYDIVPNGIDVDLFRPLGSDEPRPPGPPRILFVGRFDPRNGLHTLLHAAKILQDEEREFLIQVVGDGPARTRYQALAKRLGVWDRVEWLGLLREERPQLYREATVLAAPCTLASFGVVLLEALASGTPVVAADNVGFRQVIRDGAPGRFVAPEDSGALAAGLAEVLDRPALRADWAARGRAVAVERYSWPRVAAQVEAIYAEVLAAKLGADEDAHLTDDDEESGLPEPAPEPHLP